jgi:hypothetical protein
MNCSAPHWPVRVPHLFLLNTGRSVGYTLPAQKGRPITDQASGLGQGKPTCFHPQALKGRANVTSNAFPTAFSSRSVGWNGGFRRSPFQGSARETIR